MSKSYSLHHEPWGLPMGLPMGLPNGLLFNRVSILSPPQIIVTGPGLHVPTCPQITSVPAWTVTIIKGGGEYQWLIIHWSRWLSDLMAHVRATQQQARSPRAAFKGANEISTIGQSCAMELFCSSRYDPFKTRVNRITLLMAEARAGP